MTDTDQPKPDWRPSASLATLRHRTSIIHRIREFFARREVLEVHTPVITASGVTDIHIDSFALQNDEGFLRTSPEYAHKRLLCAGYGDIYELGPVFRHAEEGRWHNPEFTLLEWYRVGWSYRQLADEVVALLQTISPDRLAEWPVHTTSYAALAKDILGITIHSASTEELTAIAGKHGWSSDQQQPHSTLIDFIFSQVLQPELEPNTITVIHDFPACQAALASCKAQPDGTEIAQRFEVFIGRTELANGYQELTDSDLLEQRFLQDNQQRQSSNKQPMPLDDLLLSAIRYGMPDCAGVALGIERLLACLEDSNSLPEQLAFMHGQ